jgi:hypothetical protein
VDRVARRRILRASKDERLDATFRRHLENVAQLLGFVSAAYLLFNLSGVFCYGHGRDNGSLGSPGGRHSNYNGPNLNKKGCTIHHTLLREPHRSIAPKVGGGARFLPDDLQVFRRKAALIVIWGAYSTGVSFDDALGVGQRAVQEDGP